LAVEDVIAENKGAGTVGNEALANEKGLRQTFGSRLLSIVDAKPLLLACS
jgi:hypothetical protein